MSAPHPALVLEPVGDGRYRVPNDGDREQRDVVFGGQLLAQSVMAAVATQPAKLVRTIHAVFARPGRVSATTELAVDTIHDGRSLGSVTVTAWQGDRLCARCQVLLDAGDPDLIRHAAPMPAVTPPEALPPAEPGGLLFPGAELRIVDEADTWDPAAPVAPAELCTWTRWAEAPDDPAVNQAALAWGTDGFLIGTAMRPHAGIGQDMAHRSISTGVIGHTLTFHERIALRDWLLVAHESPWAGQGRSYGRAQIFDRGGRLVASYVQDNMIRAFPPDQRDAGAARTVM